MAANSILCGVVVTYHPVDAVLDNVRAMADECGRLVVVDNGSSPAIQARLAGLARVELVALGKNLGVGAALNTGVRHAAERGSRWVVTFDQDSSPQPGMVEALRATAARNPGAAVVVPCIIEADVGGRGYRWVRRHPRMDRLFQRIACDGADLPAVTMAVTSGSLIELNAWQQLGGFDESLFIDYIDIDYCLKVVRSGRFVTVSARAKLTHKLGARQTGVLLGHEFRPTHHPAFRHYYIARNRVWMWRRHAKAVPHFALFDLCFAVYNGLRVLAFEPAKWVKLKAMILGTWDGVGGRSGPCPDNRMRVLRHVGTLSGPR
jgi:rhamnosyltransferase